MNCEESDNPDLNGILKSDLKNRFQIKILLQWAACTFQMVFQEGRHSSFGGSSINPPLPWGLGFLETRRSSNSCSWRERNDSRGVGVTSRAAQGISDWVGKDLEQPGMLEGSLPWQGWFGISFRALPTQTSLGSKPQTRLAEIPLRGEEQGPGALELQRIPACSGLQNVPKVPNSNPCCGHH